MLLYTRKAPVKPPKRRSRAGCVHCKEKKKKCNEDRPACDRCTERGLKCEYEPIKPRKRRRTISPSEITAPTLHVPPPTSTINSGFLSRLQALRSDPASGMSSLSTSPTPRLSAIAEGWEIRSAYDEPSNYGEFFSDSSLSPFDPLEPFHAAAEFTNSPVEAPIEVMLTPRHERTPSLAPTTPDMITSAPILAHAASPFQRSNSTFSNGPSSAPIPSFIQVAPSPPLLDHFCHELAPLLVFKEQGNPFLDHLVPLSSHSSVLQSALYAVAGAHLENLDRPTHLKSLDLHSKALQGLATSLGRKDSEDDEDLPLAATLLLLYYEVIRSSSSVVLRSHLSGAHSMMQGRLAPRTPTTVFLERAFRYFDVLSALSSGRSPLTGSVLPTWDRDVPHIMEPSALAAIDPLFGLMADLWPILHRLAELVDMKRQIADQTHRRESLHGMQSDLDTSAANIELFLHQWKPTVPPTSPLESCSPGAADARLQSTISHAEAYKQAALIHLHREVYAHARASPQVQGPLKATFQACLRVMMFSGPIKGLLWPLFTAAVEAAEQVDVNVARTCFRQLEQRQGMNSILFAWEVCEEVWARRNQGEEHVDWRLVAEDMGREIIFG